MMSIKSTAHCRTVKAGCSDSTLGDVLHRYRRYRPGDPVSFFPARPRRLDATGAFACAVGALLVVYRSIRG